MVDVSNYLPGIKKSLSYLIKRNCDINIASLSDEVLEQLDENYCSEGLFRYILFVNNDKYEIDFATTISDANYIINHIDHITYVFSEFENSDSYHGRIRDFVKSKFIYPENGFCFNKACFLYEKYVNEIQDYRDIKNVLNYIRENIDND